MLKKIQVLIVDDSAFIRQLFTNFLSSDNEIKVIGTAKDPYEAREKIKSLNPDVVTLDIEMPNMDGLSFLHKIMTLRPMPVVMVSTLTQKNAQETLKALEMGAIDFISKPVGSENEANIYSVKEELIEKVKIAAKARIKNNFPSVKIKSIKEFVPSFKTANKIIAIGASTGGVEALREIISELPANSPPIVITQHMPEKFTLSFAKRLDSIAKVQVHEAKHNQPILSGNIYIAPGNFHLEVAKFSGRYICKIIDSPIVSGHRPSVDVLFSSVAKTVGKNAVGVILTGMGRDGAEGLLAMRENGSYNIGQNEQTCVVYGMPKIAKEKNAVNIELPLENIANGILNACLS
ncbi:MAG: chemotaxis response regulator protein-glutamate methylesterase [Alphaproteobacteria bacterium]